MCQTSREALPRSCDVILGRGKMAEIHPGNRAFQELISQYVPRYHASNSRKEKNRITHELVQLGQSKGIRFLRRDIHDRWADADLETVRIRVGQSLRYIHKQQQQQHSELNNCKRETQLHETRGVQAFPQCSFLIEDNPFDTQVDNNRSLAGSSSKQSRSGSGRSFFRDSFFRRASKTQDNHEKETFQSPSPSVAMQLDSGFLNVASGDLVMEYETDPLHFSEDFSLTNSAEFGRKHEMRGRMEPFRRSV